MKLLAWLRAEFAEVLCLLLESHAWKREGGVHVCTRCPAWRIDVEVWTGTRFARESIVKRGGAR